MPAARCPKGERERMEKTHECCGCTHTGAPVGFSPAIGGEDRWRADPAARDSVWMWHFCSSHLSVCQTRGYSPCDDRVCDLRNWLVGGPTNAVDRISDSGHFHGLCTFYQFRDGTKRLGGGAGAAGVEWSI